MCHTSRTSQIRFGALSPAQSTLLSLTAIDGTASPELRASNVSDSLDDGVTFSAFFKHSPATLTHLTHRRASALQCGKWPLPGCRDSVED